MGIHLIHDITISISTFEGFIVTCASLYNIFPIFAYFYIIFSVRNFNEICFLLLLYRSNVAKDCVSFEY